MMLDLRTDPPPEENDIVIVGSGAVGLCMAVHLARKGHRVTVLEAGPELPDERSQAVLRAASASGRALPGLRDGRIRALGGTTNAWAGQLVAIDAHVLEPRPWLEAQGWPVAHRDIRSCHDDALVLLGMKRALTDAQLWQALKVEPPAATDEIVPFFTRWAPQPCLAALFREDIRRRDNLRICLHAQATALHSTDGQVVDAATVATGEGGIRLIRGRHFVLACGTVETVRLLLHPLGDGRPAPWSGNPWLGRGFMDHVDCFAGTVEKLDAARFADLFEGAVVSGNKYLAKLRLNPAAQRSRRLLDVAGHFVHHSRHEGEIAAIKALARHLLRRGAGPRPRLADTLAGLPHGAAMALRYLRRHRIRDFHDQGISLRLTAEQAPQPRSRIALRSDRDRNGARNVEVAWQVAPAQIDTLAGFAECVRDYLAAQGLARTMLDQRLTDRDPAFLDTIDDANHHMGGARMAQDAGSGVVDADLRVFGTQNLHVAGAAVYPASGFHNPTFTAIALGLRLADRLAGAGR